MIIYTVFPVSVTSAITRNFLNRSTMAAIVVVRAQGRHGDRECLNSVFGTARMTASSLGLQPLSESPVARPPPDVQALP